MKTTFNYLLLLLIAFSCNQSQEEGDFLYDPTVPYPLFDPGDFWLDSFDERGLQNASVYNDDLYCNTIGGFGEDNYLYCFSLSNGTVKWRMPVKAFSTQPITIINDNLIYCSYLGQIQVFDKYGNELWSERSSLPYGGHWADSSDLTIKISTPYGSKVSIHNLNGKNSTVVESEKIKKDIARFGGRVNHTNKQYQVNHKNWNYSIDISTPGTRKHSVVIKKISITYVTITQPLP